MNGSLLGLLLPEALVRIQFVTTIKPLIIEYLGTPAGKYGALAAALFFYMMHRMLPLLSVKIPNMIEALFLL